jgi:hypothetical protein
MDPDLLVTGAVPNKTRYKYRSSFRIQIKTETFPAYLSNNTGGGKVKAPTPVSGFCTGGEKHLVISPERKKSPL